MENITISQIEDLKNIIDVMHDCWFDIDSIRIDNGIFKLNFNYFLEERQKLLSNFFFVKQFELPQVECILEIYNVNSYEIVDTEKVKYYDFNEIVYDHKKNLLLIRTGIPLSIKIHVSFLKISIIFTDKVVRSKKIWRL